MIEYYETTLPFLTLIFFVAGGMILRNLSGMNNRIDTDTGEKMYSLYGSARINGCSYGNSICISVYEKGYLIKASIIFGGGKLWVPEDELMILPPKDNALLTPKSIALESQGNKITLYGRLVDVFI